MSLFVTPPLRRRVDNGLTDRLEEALAQVRRDGASPTHDVEAFRAELDRIDFEKGEGLDATVEKVVRWLTSGMVQLTHPGYLGLFNPAPAYAAEVADRIAAAFNPQMAVWSHAPVPVDIEAHVIQTVARKLGLDAQGHFTSGGSEANATAVVCGLTHLCPEWGDEGTTAFGGAPKIYASAESHLAWLKIAHMTGMGRHGVRLVATDGQGRMDPIALRRAVEEDKASGHVPSVIAATAGTTNAGMIDPLAACASVAQEHGLWFHVDAAWGGALAASDRERHQLAGIDLADSVTVDAHKWFATTMGTGMFFTQRHEVLSQAFRARNDYMPSNDAAIDPYITTMQWSRRFSGLRLYLSLAANGWGAYAEHVERGIELIDGFNALIRARGWQVVNPSRMAIACVAPPSGRAPIPAIVERIVTGGSHWISVTKFEGRPVIRLCVTHGETTSTHLEDLVERLEVASQVA